jgi:Ca-activated chloride channel homolog
MANQISNDFRWSACVAAFGMMLTQSQYLADGWDAGRIVTLAQGARGEDIEGYRSEFINLVRSYGVLDKSVSSR